MLASTTLVMWKFALAKAIGNMTNCGQRGDVVHELKDPYSSFDQAKDLRR